MSSLKGKLADRASIVAAGFSDFEKSIIKATKHNTKYPKEKHVRRLISSTSDYNRASELVYLLAKRLEVLDWIVVLKTLCVFHRIMREGNSRFISELKNRSSIFNLRKFSDVTTPEAHNQSIFIRKYSQFLEEKVLLYKILNVEFEKEPGVIKSFTAMEVLEKIPRLQSQLNALLNTRGSKDYINNSIIVYAFNMLLKDSFPLYRALNDGIIILLEHYFTMPKENAVKCLDIYRLFTKETDGMIQFFEIAKRFSRTQLPTLQNAPTTLIEALENYVKELDNGKGSGQPSKLTSKPSTIINFSKNQMKDFDFQGTEYPETDSDDDESASDYRVAAATHSNNTANGQKTFAQTHDDFNPRGSVQPVSLLDDPFHGFGNNTTNNNANNTNNGMENPFAFGNTNAPTFDPFQQSTQQQQGFGYNNDQAYLEKKKQIEMLMQATAISSPPPAMHTNNNGFGGGFGGPSNMAPSYSPAPTFSPNNNATPTFSPPTTFSPQPVNPFAAQPQQPVNPFASVPQQPQPQPQQQFQTHYNPFA